MVAGCRGGPGGRRRGEGARVVEVGKWGWVEGKQYKENGRDTLQRALSRLIMQQG